MTPAASEHHHQHRPNFFFRLLGFTKNPLASPDLRLSMVSNFSTSYNVVNVSLVLDVMNGIYGDGNGKSLCSSALIAGMIVGQLVGGAIGDKFGRHKAMTIVMMLQILASIGSALSCQIHVLSSHFTIYTTLAMFRFFLGVGCGGVYPLAATMTAESTSTKAERGKLVALTFSMQGVGYICVPIVQCLLISLLGEDSDSMWRLILGLGSVPGVCLSFARIARRVRHQSHESAYAHEPDLPISEHTAPLLSGSQHNNIDMDGALSSFHDQSDESSITEAVSISPSIADTNSVMALDTLEEMTIVDYIRNESNLIRKLIGTAGTWFLFDVLFYGNTLFERVVLDEAFGQSETIAQTATDTLLISAMALPGYFVSIAVIGRVNPRYVQMQGFIAMAILYGVIGVCFDELAKLRYLLIVLYGSTFFFANFGPNATTFMLPSIIYSPRCRSTLNGVSAASGKAGALLGASFFEPMADTIGDQYVMLICAGVSIVGFLLTYACVPLRTQDDDSEDELAEKKKSRKKERRKSQMNEENVRNGEVRKSYSGYEFWRRRNFSVPSFIDYADSDVESSASSSD
uniref:Major facilitator superfamily (MFS) profile domain-containing protein n=1 Tax=Leptocylindrus danicus TaxID=163516 RepID=A0A7S2P1E8_9STRA